MELERAPDACCLAFAASATMTGREGRGRKLTREGVQLAVDLAIIFKATTAFEKMIDGLNNLQVLQLPVGETIELLDRDVRLCRKRDRKKQFTCYRNSHASAVLKCRVILAESTRETQCGRWFAVDYQSWYEPDRN
jgi:hypothetical protein